MDDVIGVAARGKYGRGAGSKAVFINSKTHQVIGEIPTGTAAHIIDSDPANPRWAYVKTDTAESSRLISIPCKRCVASKPALMDPAWVFPEMENILWRVHSCRIMR